MKFSVRMRTRPTTCFSLLLFTLERRAGETRGEWQIAKTTAAPQTACHSLKSRCRFLHNQETKPIRLLSVSKGTHKKNFPFASPKCAKLVVLPRDDINWHFAAWAQLNKQHTEISHKEEEAGLSVALFFLKTLHFLQEIEETPSVRPFPSLRPPENHRSTVSIAKIHR